MTVQNILALLALAEQVEGGLEAFWNLIVVLRTGGAITQTMIDQVRAEGKISDDSYNAAIAAAELRLRPPHMP